MSRRAAAAAASLTIANMVASENGISFTPQQMLPSAPQPPPTAAASKDKKPKGLFKPPAYPSTVLRPRAHVITPTRSTAADASMSSVPADNEAPRSSSSVAPSQHDNRSNKIITAKRMKELERENTPPQANGSSSRTKKGLISRVYQDTATWQLKRSSSTFNLEILIFRDLLSPAPSRTAVLFVPRTLGHLNHIFLLPISIQGETHETGQSQPRA